MEGRRHKPPVPEGEPFRADPRDPFPFASESDAPPRQEPAEDLPAVPRWSHPPSHSPQVGQQPPSLGADTAGAPVKSPRVPATPVQRQARIALWVGVASLFVFNLFLGPIAIVMGAIAVQRGERRTGLRAIVLGGIGTVIGIVVAILYMTGVMPNLDELIDDFGNRD